MQPPGVEPVDVPDHQVAFALEQLVADPRQPAVVGGVRGVEHVEAPGRIALLVHRPDQGQLADPWFALQREPLA